MIRSFITSNQLCKVKFEIVIKNNKKPFIKLCLQSLFKVLTHMCKINYFSFLHISFIWKLYFSNCFVDKFRYTLKYFIFICRWYHNLIMNNNELVKSWYYINLCFNFLNACKCLLAKNKNYETFYFYFYLY